MEPAFALLRMFDSNDGSGSAMGQVFQKSLDLQEFYDGNTLWSDKQRGEKKSLAKMWKDRWDDLHTDYHFAAFVGNPLFWDGFNMLTRDDNPIDGFWNVAERMFGASLNRQAVTEQLNTYFKREGRGLAGQFAQGVHLTTTPRNWWLAGGPADRAAPDVARVMRRVFALPLSASQCERGWSNFDYICNKRRNRLDEQRADSLVASFSRLRSLRGQIEAAGDSMYERFDLHQVAQADDE
eukprot:GDKH01020191.1.p1 GENE.GDKH01020191.1~~GDKH01020191.1.p1  ORF type:complete len:238 (-),score=23.70 GDKH01020191.1:54-767(-)